jgi:hypothetical protein
MDAEASEPSGTPPMTDAAWTNDAEPGWRWIALPFSITSEEWVIDHMVGLIFEHYESRDIRGIRVYVDLDTEGFCFVGEGSRATRTFAYLDLLEALGPDDAIPVPPGTMEEAHRLERAVPAALMERGVPESRLRAYRDPRMEVGEAPVDTLIRVQARVALLVPDTGGDGDEGDALDDADDGGEAHEELPRRPSGPPAAAP